MSTPLKVGLEFSQQGIEEIGSAYDAALKRIEEKTKESNKKLAEEFQRGRSGYDSPIGPSDERGGQKNIAREILAAASARKAEAQAAKDAQQPILAHQNAEEKDTEETKKATDAKKNYKDALKGLALEFPVLARVMNFLTNPLTATIAILGTVIGLVKAYSAEVADAGVASQVYSDLQERVENLKTVHEQLATSTDAFARSFDDIAAKAETATESLNGWNKALLLKQQLEEELDDAVLAGQLESITANQGMTPAQKVEATAKAQSAARQRKETKALEILQQQAQNDDSASRIAAQTAAQARAAAEGMQGNVDAQTKRAKDAAAGVGDSTEADAARKTTNKEMIEFLQGLQEAQKTPGGLGEAAYILLHPEMSAKAQGRFGSKSAEDAEAELREENKQIAAKRQMAEQLAAQEERKRAALQAEQDRLRGIATTAEADRDKFGKSAAEKYNEFTQRSQARGVREPIVERTEQSQMARGINDARAQELRDLQAKLKQVTDVQAKWADTGVIGPLLDAIREANGTTVSTVEQAMAEMNRMKKQMEELKRLINKRDTYNH